MKTLPSFLSKIRPLILLLVLPLFLTGQQSVVSLGLPGADYYSLMDLSKKSNKPALIFLYYPFQISNHNTTFVNLANVLDKYDIHKGMINLDQGNNARALADEINNVLKVKWILLHPDGIQIAQATDIKTDEEADAFIQESLALYTEFQDNYVKYKGSKNKDEQYLLLESASRLTERDYTIKIFNRYLKSIDQKRLSKEDYTNILKIGKRCPYAKQFDKILRKKRDVIRTMLSEKEIADLQRKYILYDLKSKGLLEPYYVWNRYEKEIGYFADSLFRLFAIQYFAEESELALLYNEAFDFIELYPRADWELLSPLYRIVISNTDKKEDLELLLDLISFQIFRQENPTNIDYKAAILYELGFKERALEMVQKANKLAAQSGVRYKSLLATLNLKTN